MTISMSPAGSRTHPKPPAGFDPRAGSPLELRRYGLPQRSDPAVRPDLTARWDQAFSRELRYITPEFDSAVGGEGLENVVQADQDTVINMTENGNTVATTTVETPTLIKIAYSGP